MKDEKKVIESKVIPIREDEQTEFELFRKRMEQSMKDHEIRMKKMKIYLTFLIVYVVSLFIVGLSGIFFPQISRYTDLYMMFCNVVAIGLCSWSLYTFFKNGFHKDKQIRWLSLLVIVGIVMNVFILWYDIIEYIN